MKVVFDTNVLLSAIFTRGACERLLDRCLELGGCEIVIGEHMLEEFARHARGKFQASEAHTQLYLAFFRRHCTLAEPAALPSDACTDPDDLPILGVAVASNADALITGDHLLLHLRSILGIPIRSPRELLDQIS